MSTMSSEVITTTKTPENETLLDNTTNQNHKNTQKHAHHSNCNHHHHHGDKADIWTNLSSVGEFACNFVTTAYWSGGLIDLVFGLQSNALGLSYIGMAAGCVIAFLVAIGTMYAHRVLNVHHQEAEPNSSDPKTQTSNESVSDNKKTTSEAKKTTAKLTRGQYFALAGDFVSHALDYAAPITFVFTLALGAGLALWAKCLIQFLPLLVGAVCGWASLRTCKQAMLKQNEKEGHTSAACAT